MEASLLPTRADDGRGRAGPGSRADQRGRWRRFGSAAAFAVGLLLLIAGATLVWQHATAPTAYRYALGDPLPATDSGPLAPFVQAGRTLRPATVATPEDPAPLAELTVAESLTGPVLVRWQAKLDDPFLALMPPASDVAALAPVLERHVASGTSVLAWWDVSRQLALLSSPALAFSRHLGTPLFVPARWQAIRPDIEAIERDFWGIADTPEFREEHARFQRFVDALLSDEQQGMAGLQALAAGRPMVLVLHVRDAILLGQLAPRRIGVAFRDFGGATDVHGMVRRVHAWLDQNRYPAYVTLQLEDQRVRAVAFTDAPSTETLAARLLPVIGNDQRDVAGATLVYRVGGFVVYEIAAEATPPAGSQAPARARP